jgi:hypothetical protein
MKLILEPTTKLISVGDYHGRIWQGSTEQGDHVYALVMHVRGNLKDPTVMRRAILEATKPSPETEQLMHQAIKHDVPRPALASNQESRSSDP